MNRVISPTALLMVVVLALMGFIGNYLALPFAFSVAFIFGSIFSTLAIVLLGAGWGMLVAIVAASYTFFLWNHPYAVIIFVVEALWIGLALRRGYANLVLIDALYWLFLGSVLVVIFYGAVMGHGDQSVLMILLKQSINGIFNTLVASLILYIPVLRNRRLYGATDYSYKNIIFNVITFFLIVPMLSLLLFDSYRDNSERRQQVVTSLQSQAAVMKNDISQWIDDHLRAVEAIAHLPNSFGLAPSQTLQEQMGRIKNLYPDFINVYIANAQATTIGFYPAENAKGKSNLGLNFADRAYFKALAQDGKPIISNVFKGRGGTTEPIVTMSVPVMHENTLSHYALGAVNLQRLQAKIREDDINEVLMVTLIDGTGKVIISNDPAKKSLQIAPEFTGKRVPTHIDNVQLHLPNASNDASTMKVWKNSSYFTQVPIQQANWTLQVEYLLAPLQAQLFSSSILGLAAIAVLFLPMLLIASAISNALTRPLQRLASISADLPNQIENNRHITWPKTNINEITKLVANFQSASNALGSKIGTLNNRLALATDSAGIGVWDYHVKENKLIWDKWMYTLYGITEDQFGGAYEAWQSGLHPDDVEESHLAIELALNNEKDFDIEFRVLWPSGEIRHIKANAQVQRDEQGQPERMIGINYDITERKQSFHALEQAVKKAEVANEAKSEFLANMSHEIRTPMNGVIGMINLLLRTHLDEQQQNFARTVKSSAESLLVIINDILDFSKVEAGKLQLECMDFDIHTLMQDLAGVMTFRAEEKGLLLNCPVNTEEAYWLHADAGRIRQIMINLVGNAIKFTKHGDVEISYRLQKQDNNQTLLSVEIKDSGIGLSEEQQNTLFDRFSQADGSTTRLYGGTGLGLAITKQLVELMGGDIGVKSTLGEGATFWFTLPLTNGKPVTSLLESDNVKGSLGAPGDGAIESGALPQFTGKVLVVEDNPINQMVAQSQLEDFGIEVELADNGKIGLEKLAQTPYDLVFMDCQMPVMDGFEASGLIRDAQSKVLNHGIPIIAMTANVIKGDREKCLTAGMDDYIAKPVDSQVLIQVLNKWLSVD